MVRTAQWIAILGLGISPAIAGGEFVERCEEFSRGERMCRFAWEKDFGSVSEVS